VEQLTQVLKDGEMKLLEVPFPHLDGGQVLVRNHYSVISTGTEGRTVSDARLGYVAKAQARKDEVKKVIGAARIHGVRETYKMVMSRLETPATLGYSCAGEVIAVGDRVSAFRAGDRVACGGNQANHAEVVAVPVNLCVPVPADVTLRDAAFATLGSVALQGIRQADVRLGETVAVIGLGLIGQLSVQLLRAGGIRTVGIDIDEAMVALARTSGCDIALSRSHDGLEAAVREATDGLGADAVIIAAGTDSTDPVDLAGILCRKKGKVVIVGSVPTGFRRQPYYRKELDLRMSCSYGPGRYDTAYEEQGVDYPAAYVRWTENRNMRAFIDLLARRALTLDHLVTREFGFRDALAAYRLLTEKSEPLAALVLKYDTATTPAPSVKGTPPSRRPSPGPAGVALIGAGSFGRNFLLPALQGKVRFTGIATARPNNSRYLADKYGFTLCTGDPDDIFSDDGTQAVVIATRHDSHAGYVQKALAAGKHVFVEKPLCLALDELLAIRTAWQQAGVTLAVGYNRRFAPLAIRLRNAFPPGVPKAMVYRINAGMLPEGHWMNDPAQGGRIVGEACHFIDLCTWLAGAPVATVSAGALPGTSDTMVLSLTFEDGSVASVVYCTNGNRRMEKERLEVSGGGISAVLEDFRKLTVYGSKVVKYSGMQDKGHADELTAFAGHLNDGKPALVPFDDLFRTSLATFAALESVAGRSTVMPGDLLAPIPIETR